MDTLFDIKSKKWNTETLKRLPKHDIHFGTPDNRPGAGLPIGDGDTGSLIWLEKDGVHININKCDLWQDAPSGVTWDDACYCSGHEEELTCLKHGGEIVIKFGSPLFDYLYQKSFSARLSLADASVLINSETPFSSFKARAFSENGISVMNISVDLNESDSPEICLSRWGSRSLWHWYWKHKFVPETGLNGTDAYAFSDSVYITQELEPTKFCIGLKFISDRSDMFSSVKNRHSSLIKLNNEKSHYFTLFWTVKTGKTTDEAMDLCKAALENAAVSGEDALFEKHRENWSFFWEKSFLAIPDDYLENIYYLYLYYMNSESRGAYPPHFTIGLWGFYHDYIPWNYYFHYNMQHLYLPLDASGHGELLRTYFDLRKNGMEKYRLYAKTVKHKNGIFVHDVTDRFGRGAEYHYMNCSPGAQTAMHMLSHWKYTGDDEFLNNTVLPFMREVIIFYIDMLEKEEDGLYHIHNTSAYESNETADDICTDYTMIRTLFPEYIPFAENILKDKIEDVLSNLPEPILLPMDIPADWDGNTISFGIGKGKKPLGEGLVFGVGNKNGKPVRNSFGDPDHPSQIEAFPDVELSPLYPSGLLGLKDRGTKLWDALTNQLWLHSTAETTGHWNMLPIYLARMGMGKESIFASREILSGFQAFPNGLNVEGGEVGSLRRDYPAFYHIENYETGKKHYLRSDDYIHFDFETETIIAMAITECLIQSHEGLIRLCPAVCDLPVAFRLYAQGGFSVEAEFNETGFVVTIISLRGKICYVKLPDNYDDTALNAYIAHKDGRFDPVDIKRTVLGRETALDFSDLKKGETLLLSSEKTEALSVTCQKKEKINSEMKICGNAVLGSPSLINIE